MKKKIAIFASGWASQILSQYLDGLRQSLKSKLVDTYVFMCYPSWATTEQDRHGEFNILRLPNLEDFDAAIVVANGLEFNDEIDFLFKKCRKSGIPSISVGIKTDGLYYVGVDNKVGMKKLCEHLITEHNPDDNEHLYVFVPIHNEDVTFGYFIMCDCLPKIDGHFLPKYQQRLNIAFERYRQKKDFNCIWNCRI